MSRAANGTTRPVGDVTRGTTNPNRLRRVDRWIVHRLGAQLRSAVDPVVVDLGFGASPVTTLELADRLARRVGPGIRVIGVEIDPARVAQARRIDAPGVAFALGGFELGDCPAPTLVRALNVLRQYPAGEVRGAWEVTARRLAPGGILVDGTCDELGRLAAWVAIPAPPAREASGPRPVVPETLTISVDLRTLERPSRVAERLPKVLIHRNVPGEPVHALLAELDRGWDRAAPHAPFGPRQRWLAAVADVRSRGVPVLDGPSRWRLGELTVPWASVAPVD